MQVWDELDEPLGLVSGALAAPRVGRMWVTACAMSGAASATPATALRRLSGQGTSLALVGACVLAGALQAAGGDHGVAFAAVPVPDAGLRGSNQQIAIGNAEAVHPADSPADLAAEPGHQDAALHARQGARPLAWRTKGVRAGRPNAIAL